MQECSRVQTSLARVPAPVATAFPAVVGYRLVQVVRSAVGGNVRPLRVERPSLHVLVCQTGREPRRAQLGARSAGDELAKRMLSEEIELFDCAREAVEALSATHPLMLITKGDLLHQTSKLERSGLQP